MIGPQISWLPDARRLHMNHGPIDLIVEAFGDAGEVQAAYRQAASRFETILDELVAELPALRRPAGAVARQFAGSAAQRMEDAAAPLVAAHHARHGDGDTLFLTPMAAVAGAVADDILAAMIAGRDLTRAYVNDGGDIAIHLSPGTQMRAAIAGTAHGLEDRLMLRSTDAARGVATSGWRGRSFSLGIADAVTVLARTAAQADAAATVIANAVDLPGHASISRMAARQLAPDSDLGMRPVTTHVGDLTEREQAKALESGLTIARQLADRGLIETAALFLGRDARVVGGLMENALATAGVPSRFGADTPRLDDARRSVA